MHWSFFFLASMCTGMLLAYLLVVFWSQLEVPIDLCFSSKMFQLGRVCEWLRNRWLVLNSQHFPKPYVHLINQIYIEFTQESLQLVLIIEVLCFQVFLSDYLHHWMFQLFLECEIFATWVELVNQFLASEKLIQIMQYILVFNLKLCKRVWFEKREKNYQIIIPFKLTS